MPLISVDDAQAGMVLSADVTDRRGRLLIPNGRPLDEKHLQALKMWGITAVEIEGDDPVGGDTEALDPALLGQAREVLSTHLRNLPMDHPLVLALIELALPRKARELGEEGAVKGEAHV